MLNNSSEQIREGLQHAEDRGRKAAAQTDQKLKQDLLDKEQSWLMLAQSYDFTRRLSDFSDEAQRKAVNLSSETAQAVANALVMTCEALGLSNRDDAMTQFVADKDYRIGEARIK